MLQTVEMKEKSPHSCLLSPRGEFLIVTAPGTQKVLCYPIRTNGTLGDVVSWLDQEAACSVAFDTF